MPFVLFIFLEFCLPFLVHIHFSGLVRFLLTLVAFSSSVINVTFVFVSLFISEIINILPRIGLKTLLLWHKCTNWMGIDRLIPKTGYSAEEKYSLLQTRLHNRNKKKNYLFVTNYIWFLNWWLLVSFLFLVFELIYENHLSCKKKYLYAVNCCFSSTVSSLLNSIDIYQ